MLFYEHQSLFYQVATEKEQHLRNLHSENEIIESVTATRIQFCNLVFIFTTFVYLSF